MLLTLKNESKSLFEHAIKKNKQRIEYLILTPAIGLMSELFREALQL